MTRTLPVAASLCLLACGAAPPPIVMPTPGGPIVTTGTALEDTTRKEDLRMVPPEVYMRTYLQLFGALAPLDAQREARGKDGGNLFDTWDDYVAALGFPDYRLDVPRQTQTNALMVSTFERLGVALCDRALEHDWKGSSPPPVQGRVIFAFEPTKGNVSVLAFSERFDVLHRTFLGYPRRSPRRSGRRASTNSSAMYRQTTPRRPQVAASRPTKRGGPRSATGSSVTLSSTCTRPRRRMSG